MKKIILTDKQQNNILTKLKKLLADFPILPMEKKIKMYSYYRYTGKSRRLLFYIYPRSTEIIFGIWHHGTDILETFPILTSLANETKAVVLKFKIKKVEEVESKAIRSIIEMIVKHLSEKQRSKVIEKHNKSDYIRN